jgi:hypothetical protein
MDEIINGAAGKQIEEVGTTETEKTTPVGISKEELEELLARKTDELNRKWQSKLDTVIGEKKAVEGKALTVEQRIEQVEREREAERLSFARERAKLGASIDDELDAAIGLYRSNDADEIKKGADSIKAFFEKMKIAHEADKEKAIKEALAQAGAQPKPKAGKDNPAMTMAEFQKLPAKDKADYMASGGIVTD